MLTIACGTGVCIYLGCTLVTVAAGWLGYKQVTNSEEKKGEETN